MQYIKYSQQFNIDSSIRWLTRHKYSTTAKAALRALNKATTDLSDEAIASIAKLPLRTYQAAKSDLVYAGLIEITKINSNTIVVALGDTAIAYQTKLNHTKHSTRIALKALESLGITPDCEEDPLMIELQAYTDLEALSKTIPLPEAIQDIECL